MDIHIYCAGFGGLYCASPTTEHHICLGSVFIIHATTMKINLSFIKFIIFFFRLKKPIFQVYV